MLILADMGKPRQIAVIHDYDSLIEAIHTRIGQLGTTQACIGAVAGFHDGYAEKLLCGTKTFGPMSFSAVLGALGMKLIAVEDPEALARVHDRLEPRKHLETAPVRYARAMGVIRKFGRDGGKKRLASLTPDELSAHQSAAAKARWRAWRRARAERRRQAA